jgi:nicotinamidase-related amidase
LQRTKPLRKGTNKEIDSYSAFYAMDIKNQPVGCLLRGRGVTAVYLADWRDYCVYFTAKDALAEVLTLCY